MRAVIQRVSRARVSVGGRTVSEIGAGLLVLLGVGSGDTEADLDWMVEKTAGLRIFEDEAGKMNLAVGDVNGAVLVVSQFTLYGDCRRGKRPSFTEAAEPGKAAALYEAFARALAARGLPVGTGEFGARMQVDLCNDGPVTILLDTRREP